MKNKVLVLSILVLLVLTSFSCKSVKKGYTTNINTTTTYKGEDINVFVDSMNVNKFGYDGFKVFIENNSPEPLTINFAKSSISYLESTHLLFVSDMKYIKAGEVPPSITIPSGIKTKFDIYSSLQPYISNNRRDVWSMSPILVLDNTPVTLLLCIEKGNVRYYWTSNITYNE